MSSIHPTSSAQSRTWFLERWLSGTSQYHIGRAWRLEGELSLPALTAALQALVARHESLRTGFVEEGGEPLQRIVEALDIAPRVVDLTTMPTEEQEARLTAALAQAFEEPFDLASPPLLRVVMWRLGPGRQVMLLVEHHIISDGWSRGILLRELGELYGRALRGESLALPPLPLQYADYALWQREVMAGEAYRESLAQWQARLSGLEPLELPTDHPRAAEVDYTGGLVEFKVAPELTASLKALARAHGATLYMVLLAVMQVLLMRLSGQRDIAVGSPVAGRGRSELEGLVGFFVNTLVLRTAVEPEESFAALLDRVREVALDAYGRAEVPFEELVRVLNPARDASRHPLFQVMLALQNLPPAELSLTGLVVRGVKVPRTTTKFDLSMTLVEREGGLVGTLEYASALFEAATMQRWVGHYLTLLSGVADSPGTAVSRLPLLTAAERARLWAWNDTATGEPVQETLHGVFEAQVRATPEALAVVGEGGQLTYAALDARAEAVARGLRGLGVEVGTRVGVCLPRSLDLVVGVLGILKAGGAYVPLDPTYPASRLEYMVEDAGLALVLAPEVMPTSVLPAEVRSISVTAVAAMPGPAEWPRSGPRDLAYVIYTSGSTGRPKGVLINHGAACTHLQWLGKQFGFASPDRLLMRASTSFDVSVWELFSALHCGAGLVLARSASDKDPEAVAADIREHAVTAFMAVPSMLSAVLAENLLAGCASLRLVFAGGEALAATTVNAFNAQSLATLINLYGPTEHSIWSIWWPCPRGHVESTLIGRPIPPVEAWVFDERGELSPEGIPGELFLGGAGLAEGYLNRPELTAEKFVPHPFKPGARLYRTGDRVRWWPDGNLEFLGRLDAQVKLRGYRIELGEIEAALLAAGAAQAAVLLREDREGDPRLVAYVAGVASDGNSLRESLRGSLPDFMVPSAIVKMPEIPRTPNGKLDRRALPAPEFAHVGLRAQAPESETEQGLAALWREILGVEHIGRTDDFFALGGHSLLILRLRARVNARFACALGMRDLFVTPVLKDQSALIERARNSLAHPAPDTSSTPMPELRSRDRSAFRRAPGDTPRENGTATKVVQEFPPQVESEYPASFAQERMWMRAQARTGGAPNTVNFAWRLQGRPDRAALQAALDGLIARHTTLRTSLALEGDVLVARVHSPMPAPFDIIPGDAGGSAEQAAMQRDFLLVPFDAAAPCQLRARLLALAPDESLLLLAINHIAADGFSQSLLQRDFSRMYAAALEDGQAALPVPGSHALFAQHQRAGAGEPAWLEARRWWQSRLASPPRLSLPLLRSHQPQGEGDQVSLTLSASSWREIGEFSRRSGVSTFTVCLSALTLLLHRLGGQRDLLIGTPVAHRDNPAFHEMVGCCLNDLALRIGVPGNATGQDLLAEVAACKRESFAHRDIPIEQVISDLGLQGAAGRHPLFDVMFNMIPWPAPSMELPGLAVTRLAAWQLETPVDLCFYLNRQPSFYEPEELAGDPGVRLFLLFRRGRLARDDAQLMLAQFADLIVQLVRDPKRRLTDYALVQPDEVVEADTGQDEPIRSAEPKIYPCVISAVREQCRLSPEATAIEQGSQRLTYVGLSAMVERLVAQFVEAGVIKGDVLALCLPRSSAFVAAILASLRVGAVVMPLEQDTPPARLNAAMQHAHWRLSPGQSGNADSQLEWLRGDARQPEPRSSPARSSGADSVLAPSDPAYLFFTSGSTGEPKGILGRYAGLCQFIAWQTATFGINAPDRVSGLTSLGFDPVLREIFLPLVNGGTLCLPPADLALDEEPVWLAESGITVVHFVPSRLRAWLSAGEMCAMPSLRLAIFSGEVLHGELVESFRQFLADGCRVINFYGPTETTMIKSWFEVPIPASPGVQPIGRALWDTEILVTDTEGRVCGAGVAGELVIRTAYASLGYLGDMRDAWRFSPDPKQPGVREISYRTGDLGCRDARGILHILGRIDHQVKINGVRIEPESVESVLATHPAVRSCAVVNVPAEGEHQPGLVAWIVPVGQMPELGSLRRFLAEWLQPAAIPGVFAPLAALPILPNGKVDRAALSRRSVVRPAGIHGRTTPTDPTERALAAVWKSLLPAVAACPEDDFFALGGNSLLGTRLINRLQLEFGVEAGLRDLFAYPSLQEMAAWLRSQHAIPRMGNTP